MQGCTTPALEEKLTLLTKAQPEKILCFPLHAIKRLNFGEKHLKVGTPGHLYSV
jgi:hypothetical protein